MEVKAYALEDVVLQLVVQVHELVEVGLSIDPQVEDHVEVYSVLLVLMLLVLALLVSVLALVTLVVMLVRVMEDW